jgi:hypothetical protein
VTRGAGSLVHWSTWGEGGRGVRKVGRAWTALCSSFQSPDSVRPVFPPHSLCLAYLSSSYPLRSPAAFCLSSIPFFFSFFLFPISAIAQVLPLLLSDILFPSPPTDGALAFDPFAASLSPLTSDCCASGQSPAGAPPSCPNSRRRISQMVAICRRPSQMHLLSLGCESH